jgi:hypothetical protein
MKEKKEKRLDDFLENEELDNVETLKQPDGLIERKIIEKKLIAEDGRELLKEELPISHTIKKIL